MPYEYQTNEDPIDLKGVDELLPDELSGRYFQNLDSIMQRSDKQQLDRTLGELSDRGFLRSGDAFTRVATDVLGPSQERRNTILLPELRNAALAGREERLQSVAFDRQKEAMRLEHQFRLEEMVKQAEIRRQLLELQDILNGDSGGFDWGGIAGTIGGGLVGSIGGTFGAQVGSRLGASLFSNSKASNPTMAQSSYWASGNQGPVR